MFMFEFYRNLNGYIPLIILIPNFMGFFVVTGMTLFVISCISSVDSSPNLLFFADGAWLPARKFYAEPHLPHQFPHKVKRRYNRW